MSGEIRVVVGIRVGQSGVESCRRELLGEIEDLSVAATGVWMSEDDERERDD